MRPALILWTAAAALGAAGCTEMGPPYEEQTSVLASVRPIVHMDRTHLDSKLEMDGDMGRELAVTRPTSPGEIFAAFSYLPINEQDPDRDVGTFWLDALVSDRLKLIDAESGPPLYARYGLGWSLLYMDFDSGHGSGKSRRKAIDDRELELRFLMHALGMAAAPRP